MPFITKERRRRIASGKLQPEVPGDWCYIYYKEMVDRWRTNPRWTTAHEIYLDLNFHDRQKRTVTIAEQLAWQVFFQLHVMPYERKMRKKNGDI